VAFRKKLYSSLEQLQTDVDQWIESYNSERTHRGKYCYGKTPTQTFLDAKSLGGCKNDREGLQRAGAVHSSKPVVRRLLTVRSSFGHYR
jgi:hypothetical protein